MNKQDYLQNSYQAVKSLIESLNENNVEDIYVLSFWKDNSDDDPRYPMITISYNTNKNVELEKDSASGEDEAKWNFAFWLQNDLLVIGGDEDNDLKEWFQTEDLYYTNEQLDEAEEDDDEWDELLLLDERMQSLFMDVIIEISNRLHREGVISCKFGKDIPVIIHELEYYDLPVTWTKRGNPENLITEFLGWVQTEGVKI